VGLHPGGTTQPAAPGHHLVCMAPNNNGATYDNIAEPKPWGTHRDVVNEV
jgi:hypothetical protein